MINTNAAFDSRVFQVNTVEEGDSAIPEVLDASEVATVRFGDEVRIGCPANEK
jgi:hypothetical protein